MTLLVLASASPARLSTLQQAGIAPLVRVSAVDEDAVLADGAERFGTLAGADAVLLLAEAKAADVARDLESLEEESGDTPGPLNDLDVLVLGCDSMLELNSEIVGKPHSADQARERWKLMRGTSGVLHTGHWLIDLRPAAQGGTGATLGATSSTTVHFADVTDSEIDDYVASGEPLKVAGGFTIDGRGGPFVRGITGDHHGVVGLSLPLLRELLNEINIPITQLWENSQS